jgi:hypothetical protein
MSVDAPPRDIAPATATTPTVRDVARSLRGPLVIALVLVALALVTVVVSGKPPSGALDPDAVDGRGSRALAQLLRDRGVDVRKVRTVDEAVARDSASTTLLVTFPAVLPAPLLNELRVTVGDLVIISPGDAELAALDLPAQVADVSRTHTEAPDCTLPAAVAAGVVDTGGFAYASEFTPEAACYPTGGHPTLLQYGVAGRTITVLGTAAAFTNDRLDREGNAALGLGVLGANPQLTWLVPDLGSVAGDADDRSVTALLPDWVLLGIGQLGVAVVLLALWRARRLGQVVTESLPVVVRAAETVEGRARLYRASRSRDRVAEALRTGSRRRVVTALGLPTEADRATVSEAVATRTGRSAKAVELLLYGGAPPDDATLVRLADDLDTLDREVRRS